MRNTLLLLAVAAGLSACATPGTGERAENTASADEPKTRRECTYERTTASRLGNKTCRDVPVSE